MPAWARIPGHPSEGRLSPQCSPYSSPWGVGVREARRSQPRRQLPDRREDFRHESARNLTLSNASYRLALGSSGRGGRVTGEAHSQTPAPLPRGIADFNSQRRDYAPAHSQAPGPGVGLYPDSIVLHGHDQLSRPAKSAETNLASGFPVPVGVADDIAHSLSDGRAHVDWVCAASIRELHHLVAHFWDVLRNGRQSHSQLPAFPPTHQSEKHIPPVPGGLVRKRSLTPAESGRRVGTAFKWGRASGSRRPRGTGLDNRGARGRLLTPLAPGTQEVHGWQLPRPCATGWPTRTVRRPQRWCAFWRAALLRPKHWALDGTESRLPKPKEKAPHQCGAFSGTGRRDICVFCLWEGGRCQTALTGAENRVDAVRATCAAPIPTRKTDSAQAPVASAIATPAEMATTASA